MNTLMKRFGAGLMALVLVLSLFVGVLPTDTYAATHQIITTPTGYTKSSDVV